MNVCFYTLLCFIIGIFQIMENKFHKNIKNVLTLIDILVTSLYFNFNVNLPALNFNQLLLPITIVLSSAFSSHIILGSV